MPIKLWIAVLLILTTVGSFGYTLNSIYPLNVKKVDNETCWVAEFGMGDLDWKMKVRVPSTNTSCFAKNVNKDLTFTGICDAYFRENELVLLLVGGTTNNAGELTSINSTVLKAEGNSSLKIINGKYNEYGGTSNWVARISDC